MLAGGEAVPDEVPGDEDAVAVVEESVVQRAEAQPVVDVVGSSEGPPTYGCRFGGPNRNRADPVPP